MSSTEKDTNQETDCPDCDRGFDSEFAMKVHYGKAHSGPLAGVKYTCDNCGKTGRREKWKLEQHESHFCSKACRRESQATGETVGIDPSGKHPLERITCAWCGDERVTRKRYGRDPSRTRFCSPTCAGKWAGNKISEDRTAHPQWRGGRSRRLYEAVRSNLPGRNWSRLATESRRKAGGKCALCGETPAEGRRSHDVHHVIPLMAGGTNGEWNRMVLCPGCHKTVENYTAEFCEYPLRRTYYESTAEAQE